MAKKSRKQKPLSEYATKPRAYHAEVIDKPRRKRRRSNAKRRSL